ncbi:MAG: hypothetical protein ACOZNI_09890 [Myxococcota bacterium]
MDKIYIIGWPDGRRDDPHARAASVRARYEALCVKARRMQVLYYALAMTSALCAIMMMAVVPSVPGASLPVGIILACVLSADAIWKPRIEWRRAAMTASALAVMESLNGDDEERARKQFEELLKYDEEFFRSLDGIQSMSRAPASLAKD